MKPIYLLTILLATLAFAAGRWTATEAARHAQDDDWLAGKERRRFANRFQSHGACERCLRTWDVVKGHSTYYEWTKPGEMHMIATGETVHATNVFGTVPSRLAEYLSKPQPVRGCFPLCERCWTELETPEARLPYYKALHDKWGSNAGVGWDKIRDAVLSETNQPTDVIANSPRSPIDGTNGPTATATVTVTVSENPTNTINALIADGTFCKVRGHMWANDVSYLTYPVYYPNGAPEVRKCQVCSVTQSRHQTEWK